LRSPGREPILTGPEDYTVPFHSTSAGMALAEAREQDKPRVKAEYAEVLSRLLGGMRTRDGEQS